jgi:cytochrome c biogenesis protein CcdA
MSMYDGRRRLLTCIAVTWFVAASAFAVLVPSRGQASASVEVPVIYFYTEGCSECQAVEILLTQVESRYAVKVLARYEALDEQGASVRSALDDTYGTPAEQRGVAPTIFIGRQVLLRQADISAGLEQAVKTSTTSDVQYLQEAYTRALSSSGGSQEEFFRGFGILTVIGAGLLDGVNPCAFATLIFFISYLIMRSKRKKDILLVGLAFGAGVFSAYFAAGLGLYRYVAQASWFFAAAKWFYLVIGLFSVVIAFLSARDAYRVRHGKLEDMSLQLPARQKDAIHRLIRKTANTGFLATSAFLVAFPVSLFEFLCTGQTYLPTIVLIYSQNILRARATLLLVVYNLLFILPLIVITVVAYAGTSSERMVAWLTRNAVTVKVATTVLFLAMGGFLLQRALTLLGVIH